METRPDQSTVYCVLFTVTIRCDSIEDHDHHHFFLNLERYKKKIICAVHPLVAEFLDTQEAEDK